MTTRTQPQDKMVTANGLKLHYLEWGTADNPTMVLLHGLRGHAHSWDSFSEPMSQDYHVLALDQRGRGGSDWAADGAYTPDAYVKDFTGFCEELKLESFVLVGHSMGARNGMGFASLYPKKVRSLVVVDAPPSNMPDGDRIRQEILGAPEEFDSFEQVFNHIRAENPLPSEEVLRRRVKYQVKELPNGKIGWNYDIAIREGFRQPRRTPPPGMWDAWKVLTCPTLIVRGLETDALTPEAAKEMLDSHPNSQLVEIPGAAHMVFEENPEGFLTQVRNWLQNTG
jgi:esterase